MFSIVSTGDLEILSPEIVGEKIGEGSEPELEVVWHIMSDSGVIQDLDQLSNLWLMFHNVSTKHYLQSKFTSEHKECKMILGWKRPLTRAFNLIGRNLQKKIYLNSSVTIYIIWNLSVLYKLVCIYKNTKSSTILVNLSVKKNTKCTPLTVILPSRSASMLVEKQHF